MGLIDWCKKKGICNHCYQDKVNAEINFMKKAQGLSLDVVVISALVLLVLIVLSVIFVGRMANYPVQCEQRLFFDLEKVAKHYHWTNGSEIYMDLEYCEEFGLCEWKCVNDEWIVKNND